ncbi:hypothetical protein THARTR1_03972 [Trichoderma harzianum]|uniref:Uncharacterized protein n=1 Tax=Trichoderma harzianum TaxID=5544 RepID=A0A2K0UD92_TRIHA|nr:hypothetical protein THARTR1_03972 [Trichoderma harzianum]
MIVHSGAALHGHEFSTPPAEQPQPSRFSFLSALRPLFDTEPTTPTEPTEPTSPTSPTSPVADPNDTLPPRSASVAETRNPRSSLASRRRTTSDIATVRFREPHSDIVGQSDVPSEDEDSVSGSEASERTDSSIRLKRRKRGPRKSSRYALAFPAPGLRTKQRAFFQIRPRVLLQLQKLGEKRAIPAFDVVPSSLIAGSLIIPALVKAFPRMFHAKPHLGQNDLLLVRRDDFAHKHDGHGHDNAYDSSSSLDHKDVLAVICTSEDDDYAKIVLQDGTSWVTSAKANGSYEFNHINEHGEAVKARWIKRPLFSPRASWGSAHTANTTPPSPTTPTSPDGKWTFSIIEPSTRRHPVQGILDSACLEIYDTYTTMSTSSGIYSPIAPDMSGISEDATNTTEERPSMEVSEYNKTLMMATATWISLRQRGWPASATPKIPRAVSQRVSSGRAQTGVIETNTSGEANPRISLADASPEDLAAARNLTSGKLRRAMSSGSEFMRKRREAAAVSATSSITERESDEKHADDLRIREQTGTCRTRVRRLAQRVFHHSSNQRVS